MPSRPRGALLAALAAALLLTLPGPAIAALNPAPGGPILVVTSSADPFGWYYTEILARRGAQRLRDGRRQRPVGRRPSPATTPSFSPRSASTDAQVEHARRPGYRAAAISSPCARTSAWRRCSVSRAVSVRTVGAGHAAAFTYDFARSISPPVRATSPGQAENRDEFAVGANPDPIARSNDLFFGNDPRDPQPDWVDLGRGRRPAGRRAAAAAGQPHRPVQSGHTPHRASGTSRVARRP